MITPEKEIVHLHVKDDIPYLVGDRNARSNRHRPVSEDILEHTMTLKEIVGIEQDGGEAEKEEEVGDPQYALAGEEDGVGAVDFGPRGPHRLESKNLVKRLVDVGPSREKTKLRVKMMLTPKQVLKSISTKARPSRRELAH